MADEPLEPYAVPAALHACPIRLLQARVFGVHTAPHCPPVMG
jgi:hypothetical protein